jgi:hydroxymethylpyrimidine/phosphomethylpyrimidine kinase
MTVITAITAQNTVAVDGVEPIPPDFVGLQFESVLTDIGIDGVKTGMLFSPEIVQVVAAKLRESRVGLCVVDPVMVSKGGSVLLESDAIRVLKTCILPLATLVTPNLPEAELLAGIPVRSEEDMKAAARRILELGCEAVLIKGGHLEEDALDILFDGEGFIHFTSPRIKTPNTHGTGCTYSAAILANLILGHDLKESIRISKSFVTTAIQRAFPLGKGHGPLNHFVLQRKAEEG